MRLMNLLLAAACGAGGATYMFQGGAFTLGDFVLGPANGDAALESVAVDENGLPKWDGGSRANPEWRPAVAGADGSDGIELGAGSSSSGRSSRRDSTITVDDGRGGRPLTQPGLEQPGLSRADRAIEDPEQPSDGAPLAPRIADRAQSWWSRGSVTAQTADRRQTAGNAARTTLQGQLSSGPGGRVAATNVNNPVPKQPVGTRTASGWVIIGHSAEGRPLHVRRLGDGEQRTLIVAGLDGEDRIAVNWIDTLAQRLEEAPETIRGHQLVLLRAANPDGLTAKHHENSRGVALNRNFPTAGYRPLGTPSAGKGPASEPETRIVLELLYELQPARVVHLQSTARTAEARCNGVAAEAASSLGEVPQLDVKSLDVKTVPGSIEDFVTSVLGAECVGLQLPAGDDWRSAAITHFPTLVTAAVPRVHRTETAKPTVPEEDPAESPFSIDPPKLGAPSAKKSQLPVESATGPTSAPIRPRRLGYEELPPPPGKGGR